MTQEEEILKKHLVGFTNETVNKIWDSCLAAMQEISQFKPKGEEQTDAIVIKAIPEVKELDATINTFVQTHRNGAWIVTQESFWKAIDAIQKSIPQNKKAEEQTLQWVIDMIKDEYNYLRDLKTKYDVGENGRGWALKFQAVRDLRKKILKRLEEKAPTKEYTTPQPEQKRGSKQ